MDGFLRGNLTNPLRDRRVGAKLRMPLHTCDERLACSGEIRQFILEARLIGKS